MQATQTVTPRPATLPDTDIGTIPTYPCEGASVVRVGAVCDTPRCTLTCRVIFWDAVAKFAAASAPVTFTSDAIAIDGDKFIGTPGQDDWFPVGGPAVFGIHIDAVSGGNWTITPMAS